MELKNVLSILVIFRHFRLDPSQVNWKMYVGNYHVNFYKLIYVLDFVL